MTACLTLLVACLAQLPMDEAWEEFTLDNGIRVSMVRAKDSPAQATFTLLPLGLVDDDAERAQFAHLVEHLALRSTDPEGFEADGILLNGETTSLALRLETIAPLEKWRAALRRHAAWLRADSVDEETLAREKANIASEAQTTAMSGYTHKWALAAWNQVVRHGASHARVAGDVETTTAETAQAYLRDRLRPGPAVRIVSVGPVAPDALRAAIIEDFGDLPSLEWRASVPSVDAEQVTRVGERRATWDLGTRHYLEWYAVPDDSDLDRAAADALALLINVRLQQQGALAALGIHALAAADLITPEGRWLLVTVAIPPDVDVELVIPKLRQITSGIGSMREAPLLIGQMAGQLTDWPDFAALREQFAGQPGMDWIESQQALFHVYAQMNMGLDRERLAAAYNQLSREMLVEMADGVLRDDLRSTLLLEPSESEDS